MFAGSVMLGDLDDFIAPSQSCVNPLFTGNSGSNTSTGPTEAKDVGFAKVSLISDLGNSLAYDTSVRPNLIRSKAVNQQGSNVGSRQVPSSLSYEHESTGSTSSNIAQVSLTDCLACSGCVTSAETVLIQQQSTTELMKAILNPSYSAVVVSLAPQAIVSIAIHFGISSFSEAYARLTTYFHSIGVSAVLDTQVGLDLGLTESASEFIRSLCEAHGLLYDAPAGKFVLNASQPCDMSVYSWSSVPHSRASSALATVPHELSNSGSPAGSMSATSSTKLPILTSSCPGWVCYAEKTVAEAVDHISKVKSPQQITGVLAKYLLVKGAATVAQSSVSSPPPQHSMGSVYHCSVMPCYDKKLEGSRKDFYWEKKEILSTFCVDDGTVSSEGVKEVDCVITPHELLEWFQNPQIFDCPLFSQVGFHTSSISNTPSGELLSVNHQLSAALRRPVDVGAMFFRGVDIRSLQSTPRHSVLYAADSVSYTQEQMNGTLLEDLMCSVVGDGFAGGTLTHLESDGFMDFIVRFLVKHAGAFVTPASGSDASKGISLNEREPLPLSVGKHADLREIQLQLPVYSVSSDSGDSMSDVDQSCTYSHVGSLPLVFATAYGFRSIQGVVQKLKRNLKNSSKVHSLNGNQAALQPSSSPYAYVEIMACPSGCVNGGGLLRANQSIPGVSINYEVSPLEDTNAADSTKTADIDSMADVLSSFAPKKSAVNPLMLEASNQKKRVQTVREIMISQKVPSVAHETVSHLFRVVPDMGLFKNRCVSIVDVGGSLESSAWDAVLHTRYHALPKLESASIMKW